MILTAKWAQQARHLLENAHVSIATSIVRKMPTVFLYVHHEDKSVEDFIDAVLGCETEMLRSGNFIDDDSDITEILDSALPKCRPTAHALQVSKEIIC